MKQVIVLCVLFLAVSASPSAHQRSAHQTHRSRSGGCPPVNCQLCPSNCKTDVYRNTQTGCAACRCLCEADSSSDEDHETQEALLVSAGVGIGLSIAIFVAVAVLACRKKPEPVHIVTAAPQQQQAPQTLPRATQLTDLVVTSSAPQRAECTNAIVTAVAEPSPYASRCLTPFKDQLVAAILNVPFPLGPSPVHPYVRPLNATHPSDTSSSSVAGSQVAAFADDVSAVGRQDVDDSCLYAQKVANSKYDHNNQTKEWYNVYRGRLELVGWILEAFEFTHYDSSGASFEVDKAVLELIRKISQKSGNLLEATLDALEALGPDSRAFTIFDKSSRHINNANFQMGTATEENSTLEFAVSFAQAKLDANRTSVLWFSWSSQSNSLDYASQKMRLNRRFYDDSAKAAVIRALGKDIEQQIEDF